MTDRLQPDDLRAALAALKYAAGYSQEGGYFLEVAQRFEFALNAPHLINFSADGWTIQHPLSCRPGLLDCPVTRTALGLADQDPGLYECEVRNNELVIGEKVT